ACAVRPHSDTIVAATAAHAGATKRIRFMVRSPWKRRGSRQVLSERPALGAAVIAREEVGVVLVGNRGVHRVAELTAAPGEIVWQRQRHQEWDATEVDLPKGVAGGPEGGAVYGRAVQGPELATQHAKRTLKSVAGLWSTVGRPRIEHGSDVERAQ